MIYDNKNCSVCSALKTIKSTYNCSSTRQTTNKTRDVINPVANEDVWKLRLYRTETSLKRIPIGFPRQFWTITEKTFSRRGLAHSREIFRVDAYVAAHFPPRVVWGPNPRTELFSWSHAHFSKSKCIDELAHIIKSLFHSEEPNNPHKAVL